MLAFTLNEKRKQNNNNLGEKIFVIKKFVLLGQRSNANFRVMAAKIIFFKLFFFKMFIFLSVLLGLKASGKEVFKLSCGKL